MGRKLTLTQTVHRDVHCRRCGADYFYDKVLEATTGIGGSPTAESEAHIRAEKEMTRLLADPSDSIVPCPACKALTPDMQRTHLLVLVFVVVGTLLCLGVAFGLMLMALESGVLMWWLILLALGGALIGVCMLVAWPFGLFKEKIGRMAPLPGAAVTPDDIEPETRPA
ncbi:hypothetical protein [uncultured Brevundimonas sp.]|uniref:hypothetical protein n=1 Tax=uncultured Brevundimonas sp. TaxID=213418 RepID=UPI0030EC70A3